VIEDFEASFIALANSIYHSNFVEIREEGNDQQENQENKQKAKEQTKEDLERRKAISVKARTTPFFALGGRP
jgi:hypothetical protein